MTMLPDSSIFRRQGVRTGAWRLSDLLGTNPDAPEMRDALRSIHMSARHVIGANLAARSLDPLTLQRLQTSVLRQADQARELQEKLDTAQAGDALRTELAELQTFFRDTLLEIARKLSVTH